MEAASRTSKWRYKKTYDETINPVLDMEYSIDELSCDKSTKDIPSSTPRSNVVSPNTLCRGRFRTLCLIKWSYSYWYFYRYNFGLDTSKKCRYDYGISCQPMYSTSLQLRTHCHSGKGTFHQTFPSQVQSLSAVAGSLKTNGGKGTFQLQNCD